MKTILLTGANGFIGTQIIRNLLAFDEVTVFALVRANDAKAKLEKEWWEYPELVSALGTKIYPINGDVGQPNLSMEEK